MTATIQGTIATIKDVIQKIGPATARQIETHPEVVSACRSSKAKARRLIERLQKQGHIQSTGDAQQPKFWVEEKSGEIQNWQFDKEHNKPSSWKQVGLGGEGRPCFTIAELAKEFGVTPRFLWERLHKDPNSPKKLPITFLSLRNVNYYRGAEVREWWGSLQISKNDHQPE